MLFGSEGNLGIITKAILKIHERPEAQEYNSVLFKSWSEGVTFLKNYLKRIIYQLA